MPTPSRFPQGVSNAAPWQFFGPMGQENPFYYHSFNDDFDTVPVAANGYTLTGTVAGNVSADGGVVTITTAASAAAFSELQRTQATFAPIAGKKTFFVTRVSLSDATNAALIAGLSVVNATPFTAPGTNYIWVTKPSGGTVFNLVVNNNGTVTTTALPTVITATAGVTLDIGIHVTAAGVVNATVVPNAVGYAPQSGTGATGSTYRQPNIASTANVGTTLAATPLSPVIAIQTGNSTALSGTFDFLGAFRER
jgi:hypothetical protein